MSERPNYAEECQVDRDCHNPRVRSEPACAVHARALAAEAQVAHYREALIAIAEDTHHLALSALSAPRAITGNRPNKGE